MATFSHYLNFKTQNVITKTLSDTLSLHLKKNRKNTRAR